MNAFVIQGYFNVLLSWQVKASLLLLNQ